MTVKAKLLTLLLLASALWAQAQGTLQFHATLTGAEEVPPNADPTVGTATLTLTGNVLDFYVYVPALIFITTGGSINGPAMPGSIAPVIFDLGAFRYHSGSTFGDPPFYSAVSGGGVPGGTGPFTLTDNQINELVAGLWYINIRSYAYPDSQLRGQIISVPEPSMWALMVLGGASIVCLKRKKTTGLKGSVNENVIEHCRSSRLPSAQPGGTRGLGKNMTISLTDPFIYNVGLEFRSGSQRHK